MKLMCSALTWWLGLFWAAVAWAVPVGSPSALLVPAVNLKGKYAITWTPSAARGVTYVAQEATDANDAAGTWSTVYTGTKPTAKVAGKLADKIYYYRVKATLAGFDDSPWIYAADGCDIPVLYTATANSGGTLTNGGTNQTVAPGQSRTLTITPNAGKTIASFTVDGVLQPAVPQGASASLVIPDDLTIGLKNKHKIKVKFATRTLMATASVNGGGGRIAPAGTKMYKAGSTASFNVTPDRGYRIAGILVNGVPQGGLPARGAHTLRVPMTASVTVVVTFLPIGVNYSGVWVGTYRSSLLGETVLYSDLTLSGNLLTGSYQDRDGRSGTFSAAIGGGTGNVSITESTQGCTGNFTGTGTINSAYLVGTDALLFTFTGNDCLGEHADGEGILIRQQSDVLAWGNQFTSDLRYSDGKLFWTQSGLDTLIQLDTASETTRTLAKRLGTIVSLTYDGTRLLWTEPGHWIDGSCGTRLLMTANGDGTNLRQVAAGVFCGDIGLRERVLTDGVYAYWARDPNGDRIHDILIERIPLAGGPAETLATPARSYYGMAIDATHFYWSEDFIDTPSRILRCPLSGCGDNPPETVLGEEAGVRMSNFVVVGDNLLFVFSRSGEGVPRLGLLPKGGGAITEIAQTWGGGHVMTDGDAAFWLENTTLRTVPLGGGTPVTLAEDILYMQDITLSGDRVYWAAAGEVGSFPDRIFYTPKTGGEVSTLAASLVAPYLLAPDPGGGVIYADGDVSAFAAPAISRVSPSGEVTTLLRGFGGGYLAVDANYVYGVSGFNLTRLSRETGEIVRFCPTYFYLAGVETDGGYHYWWLRSPVGGLLRTPVNLGEPVEPMPRGSTNTVDLQVHGGYAYWIEGVDKIFRAPVVGGPPQLVADSLRFPTNLLVDESFIYVIEADIQSLSKIPLGGGPKIPLARTMLYFGWYAMTQDAAAIYWLDADGIYKVLKNGDGYARYATTVLQDQFGRPPSIAVDDRYLYWTENVLWTLKRVLK